MEMSIGGNMLSNNNQRLNVWLALENRFSYRDFATACIQQNTDPLSISEFAQKVGMISVAMSMKYYEWRCQ